MTSRERIYAVIKGEQPDRIPFSAWHHFHLNPPAGANMAEAEIAYYRRYQPDFLKVMHDVPYEPTPLINTPEDWANLPLLEPTEGNYGAQLKTLQMIREGIGNEALMIDTVFNAFYYGEKLSNDKLTTHLRANPEAVHKGLKILNENIIRYAKACVAFGCDGIYYALQGAASANNPEAPYRTSQDVARDLPSDALSREEYIAHFQAYDKAVLEAVSEAPFVVLHLHGYGELYFDLISSMPAKALCWSDRACNLSLAEARKSYGGCLIGGLDERAFDKITKEALREQALDAMEQTGGKGFILAPGCAIPENTEPELIQAIGETAKDLLKP